MLDDAEVTDRQGYPYIVHPLMDGVPRVRPELVRAWTAWAWEQPPLRQADLLLAPEAMALPLVAPLCLESGIAYVVARKRVYNRPGEKALAAKTGYGLSSLYVNDVRPGDRVLVVDDVLSTGSTLDALLGAVRDCGATPMGALVFLDKGDARKTLETKHGVPILAMRSVHVESGKLVRRDA
ncbi:MAG: adenine phosphoribosyltransferase [Candidatus Thermoplasmatota archaeon]